MTLWKSMDRDAKVGAVYRLAKQGLIASEIGAELGTRSGHVHTLAREEGISITKASIARAKRVEAIGVSKKNGDIWGRSEDERRQAIIARASRAARQRLAELAKEDARARRIGSPQVIPTTHGTLDTSRGSGTSGLANTISEGA
jgi:hypothetical protein